MDSSATSLPPLLSMIIDGLPPLQQSEYVHEADERLNQFVDRHHIKSFGAYCRLGLSYGSFMNPRTISLDRLVAVSINYALNWLLDDLFIDNPDPLLQDQYGIDRSACESAVSMLLYLDHLDAVFSQRHPPRTRIEVMMWENGRDMLSLSSNQDWFDCFVQSMRDWQHISVASVSDLITGRDGCVTSLELYTKLRAGNAAGDYIQLMMEFAYDSYIPKAMRGNEFVQKLTEATSIHIGIANDVLSYHKESSLEGNPRNLITVLMKCEGEPVAESVHRAVEYVNEYGRMIVGMEAEASKWGLEKHMEDIKALIAGNVYFACKDPRYRQADSIFPEQRDLNESWKIAPRHQGVTMVQT